MSEPPYRIIAVASTFSPRFYKVLAEANRIRDRFEAELTNYLRRGKERGDDGKVCRGHRAVEAATGFGGAL